MITTFTVVRHGETAANRGNIIQGQTDVPLSETGEEQARILGRRWKNRKFDAVYSSDLSRALRTAELDVLHEDNQDIYWERDEAHDVVISLNHGQPALAALCHVLQGWVRHFVGTAVRIRVESEIDDEQWVWHVGLDAQARWSLLPLTDEQFKKIIELGKADERYIID